jgi:hypothetical protein
MVNIAKKPIAVMGLQGCTISLKFLMHTGLISSDSFQITTHTACITLKIQPMWLKESDIVTFIHVKSLKVKSGFNLRRMKKIRRMVLTCRKIKKTNLKTLVSPLLTGPQESQGCQKMHQDLLNSNLDVWFANMEPKLHDI